MNPIARSELAGKSALVASLLALIPPRPPASLVASLAQGGPRSIDPMRAFDTPLFPYPLSLKVLDVVDGSIPVPVGPGRGEGVPQGAWAVAYPGGVKLLDRVLEAGATAHGVVTHIQELALEASDPAASPEQRARLEASYRADLARLGELADTVVFDGIPLVDGSRDVYLLLPPPGSGSLLVNLPAWGRSPGLFWPSIATTVEAQHVWGIAYTTLEGLGSDIAYLDDARDLVRTGERHGGLREIERLLRRMRSLAWQAVDGGLNTSDRVVLDEYRLSDLRRLDAVAEFARFEGTELLSGGRVGLHGALGTMRIFDLPDMDASGLGLSGPDEGITTMTSAAVTLDNLDDALAAVRAERARVAETRAELVDGLLRLR